MLVFMYTTHTRLLTPIILRFLQMYSPAQLRQQSEELYATIDEVLANSVPPVSSGNHISIHIQTCVNVGL